MPQTSTSELAIELRGVHKRFGAVHANKDIDLKIRKGTIHGIIGENGAGKSTLMSILYGFYKADAGEVLINGDVVRLANSRAAIEAGVGMVHQHFMLVDTFSVLENVMLGAEQGMALAGSAVAAREQLQHLAENYQLTVNPDAIVGDLPVGEQQRTEILKALYRGAKVLILDEPTGVLTPQEADQLFRILRALREQGVTVLLITHKLREIMDVTDAVSVMRAGEMVAHRETPETSERELAELMVGGSVDLALDKSAVNPGEVLLDVKGLSARDARGVQVCHDLSFQIRAGEIVGVAGVSGNGQSELLEVLAGIEPLSGGAFNVLGREVTPQAKVDPKQLRDLGLNHVPEDRHRLGMVKPFSAAETSLLGYHDAPEYQRGLLIDGAKVVSHCQALMDDFDVRPPDPQLRSGAFSGGNQQKLIIAREIDRNPKLMLVGQPTRGVDIGAIALIHRRLLALRDAGVGILLVSVELDEILALSDRIVVMCGGELVGEVSAAEADKAQLGLMMANAREVASV